MEWSNSKENYIRQIIEVNINMVELHLDKNNKLTKGYQKSVSFKYGKF